MGGSKSKTVVDKKATAQRQASSDAAARQKFISNYNALFGSGDVPDTGFANSLSGYYGGASIGDIAKKLSRTNTFTPKVKNVTYKVKTGGGLFGGGNLGMDLALAGLSGGSSSLIDGIGGYGGVRDAAGGFGGDENYDNSLTF